MEAALLNQSKTVAANARCTMGAGPQDFGDGPSSHTSQRLPDVGAGIGPTHLPLGQQLSIQGSGSGSQGWLREGERNRAEPTIAEMWVSMATWIWWPGAAVLPLCASTSSLARVHTLAASQLA